MSNTSYLEDTFLGAPIDDPTTEIGSAGNLPAVRSRDQMPGEPTSTPMVRLPGGITMPRSTALILLAIAIAVTIYLVKSKKHTPLEHKDD